jgi:hypothetical protein
VVVVVGVTDLLVVPVTSPTALLIVRLVAPDVVQDSVDVCPAVRLAGFAEKPVIVGRDIEGGGFPSLTAAPPPPPPHAVVARIPINKMSEPARLCIVDLFNNRHKD